MVDKIDSCVALFSFKDDRERERERCIDRYAIIHGNEYEERYLKFRRNKGSDMVQ